MSSHDTAPEIPLARPTAQDREVCHYTADACAGMFRQWFKEVGRNPPDKLVFQLMNAMVASEDAFRMALGVTSQYKWPGDEELVKVFKKTKPFRREAVDRLTARWVMAHGIRFKANVGDTVSFKQRDENGMMLRRSGEVITIDKLTASAVVRLMWSGPLNRAQHVKAEELTSVVPGLKMKPPAPTPPEKTPA